MVEEMEPEGDLFRSCFLEKKTGHRKMSFDCTGAHGLHVSPRRGGGSKITSKTHTHTPHKGTFFSKGNAKKTTNAAKNV